MTAAANPSFRFFGFLAFGLLLAGACAEQNPPSPVEQLLLGVEPPKPQPEPQALAPVRPSPFDGVNPPPLSHYQGREIAVTMHWSGAEWFLRETRKDEEHPGEVLRALHLEPGMTVADVGCGNGFYTLKLAKQVAPGGKVFATEIQEEYFPMLAERAAQAGIWNIEMVQGTLINPNLPASSCDIILLVDVYHEFSFPYEMMQGIVKALKPGGRVAFVEYRGEDPKVPIKRLHKMTEAQVKKEAALFALEHVETYKKLPWQHVVFFRKTAK